jgi:fluoride exporter
MGRVVILALMVALSGAAGAISRFVVDGAVQDRSSGVVPFGTMTVNVVGSFVMGLVSGVLVFHGAGRTAVAIVGTGFCGGLTTWSAYTWETVRLLEERQHRAALVAALGGLATSLAAAAIGLSIAAL